MTFWKHNKFRFRNAMERNHTDSVYTYAGKNSHHCGNGISGKHMKDTVDDVCRRAHNDRDNDWNKKGFVPFLSVAEKAADRDCI